MTIKDQINQIQAALTEWHKSVGGACKIANDEPHLFTILGDAPGVPRTGILFDEEVPAETWTVAITAIAWTGRSSWLSHVVAGSI